MSIKDYLKVASRPASATAMLWKHRRTLAYLLRRRSFRSAYNFAFVTYFVRGEDCGKGVLDPLWYFAPWTVPVVWDLELEVTTRCPLQCRHCEHTYFPAEYAKQDISLEQFKRIIDPLPRLKWLNLTGEGSPFMNADFLPMIQYAKSKGIYIDFSHDFFTYNDKIGEALIRSGVERLYFSIDGITKSTYENVRIGSNYDRVIDNFRSFVALKRKMRSPLPELCFRFAFFKDNWFEVLRIPEFVSKMAEFGDLGDEPSANIVGLLEFEQTKGLEVELPQGVVDYTNMIAKKNGIKLYWSHVTHDEQRKPPMHYCVFWTEPYVMIDGSVVPDCAVLMSNRRPFLEANSFGNVYQEPLPVIWNNVLYRKFRRTLRDPHGQVPSICLGCRVYETEFRAKRYGVWNMEAEREQARKG